MTVDAARRPAAGPCAAADLGAAVDALLGNVFAHTPEGTPAVGHRPAADGGRRGAGRRRRRAGDATATPSSAAAAAPARPASAWTSPGAPPRRRAGRCGVASTRRGHDGDAGAGSARRPRRRRGRGAASAAVAAARRGRRAGRRRRRRGRRARPPRCTGRPSQLRAAQDAAASAASAGSPAACSARTSSAITPCVDAAAGVGAGEHRHAGLVRGPDHRAGPCVQPPHRARVGRELLLPRRREAREVLDVDQRRDDGGAAGGHLGDQVLGEPGAVLDAVDAGADQVGQRVGAEGVRGDPGALLVGGRDRGLEHVPRATPGPRSPTPRSIQSPTSFTQPSPRRACTRTSADQVGAARPRRPGRGCSGGARRCAGRPG